MSATKIVIDKLLATAAVIAVVAKKIFPIVVPEKTAPPCIVVNVVSGRDTVTLAGAGEYFVHRIQVDCIATTPTAVIALGELVMDALNGVIKETFAGCTDIDILFAGTDLTDFSEGRTTFRRLLQFRVHWRRA